MLGPSTWALLRRRVLEQLRATATADDVARVVLLALAAVPEVARAGIAIQQQGGRVLRFCPSEGVPDDGALPWCEIDGLADVPLVRALLTGRPVLLPDAESLRGGYPHLADRQERLGTRALAALPLQAGIRWGAMLVTFTEPTDFHDRQQVLLQVADATAAALDAATPPTDLPSDCGGDVRAGGDPQPDQAVVHLSGGMRAPAQARAFLRERLTAWQVADERVYDAELCLSEVVTNAVIHTGTPTEVALWLAGDRIRVEVRDTGGRLPGPPDRPTLPDPGAVGGRGLMLVEHLAHSWGYKRTTAGTTVSFEVLL